jgi:cytochrome c
MNRHIGLLLAAVLPAAQAADEADVEALLLERRCDGCHNRSDALIGPPYLAIAARHAGQGSHMVEVLAVKIVEGGAGNWGPVPMVPNEHVTHEEARAMARWILGLAQASE